MTNILENIIIELFNNNIIQFNNDNNFVFNFNDMLSLSYITNNIIKLIVTKLEHININYIIGISSFSKHICKFRQKYVIVDGHLYVLTKSCPFSKFKKSNSHIN